MSCAVLLIIYAFIHHDVVLIKKDNTKDYPRVDIFNTPFVKSHFLAVKNKKHLFYNSDVSMSIILIDMLNELSF